MKLLVLLVILLISGCSYGAPPPEAVNAASSELDTFVGELQGSLNPWSSSDAFNYDPSSVRLDRDQLGRGNIGEERGERDWCIGLAFEVSSAISDFERTLHIVYLVSKENLDWEATLIDSSVVFSNVEEYYDHVWELCLQK